MRAFRQATADAAAVRALRGSVESMHGIVTQRDEQLQTLASIRARPSLPHARTRHAAAFGDKIESSALNPHVRPSARADSRLLSQHEELQAKLAAWESGRATAAEAERRAPECGAAASSGEGSGSQEMDELRSQLKAALARAELAESRAVDAAHEMELQAAIARAELAESRLELAESRLAAQQQQQPQQQHTDEVEVVAVDGEEEVDQQPQQPQPPPPPPSVTVQLESLDGAIAESPLLAPIAETGEGESAAREAESRGADATDEAADGTDQADAHTSERQPSQRSPVGDGRSQRAAEAAAIEAGRADMRQAARELESRLQVRCDAAEKASAKSVAGVATLRARVAESDARRVEECATLKARCAAAEERCAAAEARLSEATDEELPRRLLAAESELQTLTQAQADTEKRAADAEAALEVARGEVATLRDAEESSKRRLAAELWGVREAHQAALEKAESALKAERAKHKALRAELQEIRSGASASADPSAAGPSPGSATCKVTPVVAASTTSASESWDEV